MKDSGDEKKTEKNLFLEALERPLYDNVNLSINRMGLRFDEYVEMYPKILAAYKTNTDGDETDFLQAEYTIFDEITRFTDQLYTDKGIDKRSWLWDLYESYRPWHKQITRIFFIHSEHIGNSTKRKIKFLIARAEELQFELMGVPKKMEDVTAAFDLRKKVLLLHYLDKHNHIRLLKIHPDKNHLSTILSFIIGNSNNKIYQSLSPAGITRMKQTKGVVKAIHELLIPFKEHFPELMADIEKDLAELPL